MPIVIWQPPIYTGFTVQSQTSSTNATPGTVAAAPFNKPSRVKEVARFKGWKTSLYRGTGEFSITIDSSAIRPREAVIGHLVNFDDGTTYRIEGVEWTRGTNGYEVTLTGRGIESFYDAFIYKPSLSIGTALPSASGGKATRATLFAVAKPATAIGAVAVTTTQIPSPNLSFLAPTGDVVSAIEYETAALQNGAGYGNYKEPMTAGALLRTLCGWFGVGYSLTFQRQHSGSSAYFADKPTATIFNRDPANAITIYTDDRGVTKFNYSYDARNAVNQVLYLVGTKYPFTQKVDADTGHSFDYNFTTSAAQTNKVLSAAALIRKGTAKSFFDMGTYGAVKLVDLGNVPDPNNDNTGYNDGSKAAVKAWVNQQISADDITTPTESVSFTYDNSGRYKYGEDFFLGSTVRLIDEFLGLETRQILTQVKTNYNAGAALGFDFTFGEQQITQADKLISKFSELSRKTGGARALT